MAQCLLCLDSRSLVCFALFQGVLSLNSMSLLLRIVSLTTALWGWGCVEQVKRNGSHQDQTAKDPTQPAGNVNFEEEAKRPSLSPQKPLHEVSLPVEEVSLPNHPAGGRQAEKGVNNQNDEVTTEHQPSPNPIPPQPKQIPPVPETHETVQIPPPEQPSQEQDDSQEDEQNETEGQIPPEERGTAEIGVIDVSASVGTCILYNENKVKCWGADNHAPQATEILPMEVNTASKAISLAGYNREICTLHEDGHVRCSDFAERTPFEIVDFGTTQKVVNLTGYAHNKCVVFENGQAKCWVSPSSRLNLPKSSFLALDGKTKSISVGPQKFCTGYSNRSGIKCWNIFNLEEQRIGLQSSEKAIQIAIGHNHMCALLDSGNVKCWGDTYFGQREMRDSDGHSITLQTPPSKIPNINLGGVETRASYLSAGFYHTCAIINGGKIKCWGYDGYCQLGYGLGPYIGAAGRDLTVGNEWGEMGYGLVSHSFDQPAIKVLSGELHTCALIENKVKCWGYNGTGALGLKADNPEFLCTVSGAPFVDFINPSSE